MCAYKLCKIECAFWGCQARVEKLISESVLRHTILMSHRQAWCWQDEYNNLTIDDVRKLEAETQEYLQMKMNNNNNIVNINNSQNISNVKSNSRKNSKNININDEMIENERPLPTFEKRLSIVDSTQNINNIANSEYHSDYEDFLSDQDDNESDIINHDVMSQNSNFDEFYDAICNYILNF
jgi:membrane-associated phosphatidylinositol transfer protein